MSPLSCLLQNRSVLASAATAIALAFTGCAHTYNVKVDALCNPDVAAGASYRIVPHDDVKADFDPAYVEAVQLVETALSNRGFYPAASPHDADMVVEIDVGIGSKRKRAIEDPEFFAAPPLPQATTARTRGESTPILANGFNQAPVPEAPPPTRVTVITVYQKFLTLSARETERATHGLRNPVELWRVNVSVEDSSEDVAPCLPVLVATAADKIGTSTGARQNIKVSRSVPEVLLANSEP